MVCNQTVRELFFDGVNELLALRRHEVGVPYLNGLVEGSKGHLDVLSCHRRTIIGRDSVLKHAVVSLVEARDKQRNRSLVPFSYSDAGVFFLTRFHRYPLRPKVSSCQMTPSMLKTYTKQALHSCHDQGSHLAWWRYNKDLQSCNTTLSETLHF